MAEEQLEIDWHPSWDAGWGGGVVELKLPWPPSANHYKSHRVVKTKTGKYTAITYLTKRAKEYHEEVSAIVHRHKANKHFTKPLSLKVRAYPPDRRKRDLSNLYKVLEDSLQRAGVFEDDYQIEEHYSQRRREVVKGGLLVVRIEELV